MVGRIPDPTHADQRTLLTYIELLFVREQYRQCIQICRHALKIAGEDSSEPPLLQMYVNCYLALSHDEMARVMHHQSVAKLPAYTSAEEHYIEAIRAIPSAEQTLQFCKRQPNTPHKHDASVQMHSRHKSSASWSRTSLSTWTSSPPFRPTEDSFPRGSPIPSTPGDTTSDFETESQHSFGDFTTPKRQPMERDVSAMSLSEHPSHVNHTIRSSLSRDYSSISLLDQPPPVPPQRPQSVARGLMRPIRLGSPAKAFRILPQPHAEFCGYMKSTSPKITIPKQRESRQNDVATPSSPSPVSPLSHAEAYFSEVSPISPLSPVTPDRPSRSVQASNVEDHGDGEVNESAYLRICDHLNAMRTQLLNHIVAVQQAKGSLARLQPQGESTAPTRFLPTTGTPLATIDAKSELHSSSSPGSPDRCNRKQAIRHCSFVPETDKEQEKRKRIEAGRARNWERKGFDAKKYQDLCEKALAEL